MRLALSVVMPVYNEKQIIERALAKVMKLLDPNDELIICDGGSTDGTWQALTHAQTEFTSQAMPRLALCQSRKGRANQMNTAARLAKGEILLFLHADTEINAAAIRELKECTATVKPGVRFWGRFNVRIQGKSPWLPMVAWFMNHRSRLTRIATGDQAIFVSRSLFQRIGGYFDQPLMEDIELCKTLKTQVDAFFLPLGVPVVTSGRRWDERGAWSTIWLMWSFRYQYWRGASAYDLARKYRDVRLTEEAVEAAKTKLAGLGGSGAGLESPFERKQR